ncbi:hypothetical protein EX30DRAFT_246115 [Ascodesmis nigricans]|uniref:Uncharacterized protein n=1 Tax=Ascodesmis nigricans TaxID=341454 RepID=A0A4S2MHX8_9PEZI|nr:hypothetical protein EX30DRAFT_246115 [Ascodesmis nigricans]
MRVSEYGGVLSFLYACGVGDEHIEGWIRYWYSDCRFFDRTAMVVLLDRRTHGERTRTGDSVLSFFFFFFFFFFFVVCFVIVVFLFVFFGCAC